MGLASALTTALTGLNAAETTIDVVGNNLANSNTVGFKASEANFATQFLQTLSLGGAPTDTNGGTNPMQIGLGTVVAAITPDFSQGTVEVSSDDTDMAIQGEGFFIVQGASGEQMYTRNGQFELNEEDELATATGNRLLGYGIDEDYQIQQTVLVPIRIPLGATAVAQATEHAYLEGALSPTGDLADTGSIIQTNILGTDDHVHPDTAVHTSNAEAPVDGGITYTQTAGGGAMATGTYQYRFVYSKTDPVTGTDESMWLEQEVTVTAANSSVTIDNIPHTPAVGSEIAYDHVRLYRRDSSSTDYYLIDTQDLTTGTFSYTDTTAVGGNSALPTMKTGTLNGEYTYYVTYGMSGVTPDPVTHLMPPESNSRPSPLTTNPIRVSNGRVVLSDIPMPATNPDQWNVTRIWRRNNTSDEAEWHLVSEINSVTDPNLVVVDEMPDTGPGGAFSQAILDLDGPRVRYDTLLTDVVRRDGQTYENVFEIGTLHFTGRKGGRELSTKDLEITDQTTVQQLLDFMEEAMGIVRATGADPATDIPADAVTGDQPGGYIENGRLTMLGNTGTANQLSIGLSGMLLQTDSTQTGNVDLPWATVQNAVGESAVTDFVAYDSLGIPVNVRLTAVLERRDGNSTTYRWFADSANNDPLNGVEIAVGTGLIVFDGEGNVISTTNSTVSIDRRHVASASPLEFDLDFSQISGLATSRSAWAVNRQDGSAAGTLTSFIVGEDGIIRGVFSNGVTRDLGQLRLARFANNAGLEQKGENLFAAGVNSGLAVMGNPGEQGIGKIVAGAIELSNTDIGGDLINLILASTMYQGNSRVISTSQEMLDVLLNLQR
jgi:flagellar hook protein FlgE